jgi:hypothetical protein
VNTPIPNLTTYELPGGEAGFITQPGSPFGQFDWTFWRGADGLVHLQPLPSGAAHGGVRNGWLDDARARAARARRSGLKELFVRPSASRAAGKPHHNQTH